MGVQDYAKLSDLAAGEIEQLELAGINLSPADVVKLNYLAWQVENPHTRLHLSRGRPVEVGGVYLWPLSLYGQDWFDSIGCKMGGNRICTYALAYAMSKQYDDGDPLYISNIKRAIKAWASKLRCTFGELNVAIAQVLQQEENPELPPDPNAKGTTFGDYSAFLAAATNESPEYWETRCAASYTRAVLSAILMQNRAEGKSCAGDPRIDAERAFGYAIEKIRKRVEVSDV